jgi:hypothetical protein
MITAKYASANGKTRAAAKLGAVRESLLLCSTLLVTDANLLDERSEIAGLRTIFRRLKDVGCPCEVIGRFVVAANDEIDPDVWLAQRGWKLLGANDFESDLVVLRIDAEGVPVLLLLGSTTRPHTPDEAELAALPKIAAAGLDGQSRDVLMTSAGPLMAELLAIGRGRGVVTVALQPNCTPRDGAAFRDADVIVTPSQFTADYLHEAFALPCTTLPGAVAIDDPASSQSRETILLDGTQPGSLDVVTQIVFEVQRSRPGIPLIVLGENDSGSLDRTWASAGLLVSLTLGWERIAPAAVTALRHGLPIITSDRGSGPELFEAAGLVLSLPERLTAAAPTRLTANELAPWVDTVLRFHDDRAFAAGQRSRALVASCRWAAETVIPQYVSFLTECARRRREPRSSETPARPPRRGKSVVLVPHLNGIDWECEEALRCLEAAGVRVVRRGGCSAIDVARNEMISDAIHDGAESILFIDSDIGFDPQDALRLLARPEPVVCGIYAKKGMRELASAFAENVKELLFGPDAVAAYPLRYAATGFLRIRGDVLRRMIAELRLPLCNTHWGRGMWPFFQPTIVLHGDDKLHYLGEDWAFSYRLGQIGVTPLADTSIRLWHWGRHPFSWEDAGATQERYRSYSYRLA